MAKSSKTIKKALKYNKSCSPYKPPIVLALWWKGLARRTLELLKCSTGVNLRVKKKKANKGVVMFTQRYEKEDLPHTTLPAHL